MGGALKKALYAFFTWISHGTRQRAIFELLPLMESVSHGLPQSSPVLVIVIIQSSVVSASYSNSILDLNYWSFNDPFHYDLENGTGRNGTTDAAGVTNPKYSIVKYSRVKYSIVLRRR